MARILPLQRALKHIILTAICALLNLYAKKFRCPDVLTSILSVFTLVPDFSPLLARKPSP
ncbi:hypothetical protein FDP61_19900 [Enterobacter ludwigii]|nr:hypothetical protein AM379_07420 [Enterobacter cloacae complex sp. FDA-CDC-AR_0132]AWC84270.1 hypothetical protein AM410_07435 [Enterobacter cloacae complex sp. FDA-CDC-AR_0164]KAA0510427.1 hypothetical protein F0325_22290 [Enterobacter ludwigii]KAB5484036.1 hypothetical protein F8561_02040 [Enterobacter sp. 198]TYD00986.1 hypothetical protein E4M14_023540 [Enterobacter sp. Z1]